MPQHHAQQEQNEQIDIILPTVTIGSAAELAQSLQKSEKTVTQSEEIHHALQTEFSSHNKSYDSDISLQSPSRAAVWQVIGLLGTDNLSDSVKYQIARSRIVKAIKRGNLLRGVLLYEPLKKTDNPSGKVTLHVYTGLKNGKVQLEQFDIARELGPIEVLDILCKQLVSGPIRARYTAMMLQLHGFGDIENGMAFNSDSNLDLMVSDIVSVVEKYQLNVDLLELLSCEVGTYLTLHNLLKGNHFRYVIASSNLGAGNALLGFETLSAFEYTPYAAAQKVLLLKEQHAKSMLMLALFTHNCVLWDLYQLRAQAESWLTLWKQIYKQIDLNNEYLYQYDKQSGIVRPRIVSMWEFTQQLDNIVRHNQKIDEPLKQKFLEVNNNFSRQIAPNRIAQFCYSFSTKTFYSSASYRQSIPPQESNCRHSMAVTPVRLLSPGIIYE